MNLTPKLHARGLNTFQFKRTYVERLRIEKCRRCFKATCVNETHKNTDTTMSDLHHSPAWISKYDKKDHFKVIPVESWSTVVLHM